MGFIDGVKVGVFRKLWTAARVENKPLHNDANSSSCVVESDCNTEVSHLLPLKHTHPFTRHAWSVPFDARACVLVSVSDGGGLAAFIPSGLSDRLWAVVLRPNQLTHTHTHEDDTKMKDVRGSCVRASKSVQAATGDKVTTNKFALSLRETGDIRHVVMTDSPALIGLCVNTNQSWQVCVRTLKSHIHSLSTGNSSIIGGTSLVAKDVFKTRRSEPITAISLVAFSGEDSNGTTHENRTHTRTHTLSREGGGFLLLIAYKSGAVELFKQVVDPKSGGHTHTHAHTACMSIMWVDHSPSYQGPEDRCVCVSTSSNPVCLTIARANFF